MQACQSLILIYTDRFIREITAGRDNRDVDPRLLGIGNRQNLLVAEAIELHDEFRFGKAVLGYRRTQHFGIPDIRQCQRELLATCV